MKALRSPDGTPYAPATLAVTAGRPHGQNQPVNSPITLTSTFHHAGTAQPGDSVYARFSNPSWDPLEATLAALEGAELPGLVYGSGMAAIAAALSLVPDGGTVIAPRACYNTTLTLMQQQEAKGRVRLVLLDVSDSDAVLAALAASPAPALFWLESPTNPLLEVADVPALLTAARAAGVTTVVDNTFATPLGMNPLALGADVVVHSMTKFLAGHSDVIMGGIVTDSPELRATLHGYRTVHGAISGGLDSYLALRGVRTLALRFERGCANAAVLAERLAADPRACNVRYPGLETDPGHARAAQHMRAFGAVLAFEPARAGQPSVERAEQVSASVALWTPATSLGGVESILERRRRHANEPLAVPEALVRLSVGIEDVEDLWRDLDRALGS
ncbi:PLP-dependent transferase [Micrococcales bacterium 31B]|nr:PLP-dependent transferase [Micrococcales bacterium 31B]